MDIQQRGGKKDQELCRSVFPDRPDKELDDQNRGREQSGGEEDLAVDSFPYVSNGEYRVGLARGWQPMQGSV